MSEIKLCEYCGRDKNVYYRKAYNKYICNKHSQQLQKYGKISRTRYTLNEYIIYDTYAEIVLYDKNGYENARGIIDIEDVDKIKNLKWFNNGGYLTNKKYKQLHKIIMNHKEKTTYIDHINRNTLDNRKSNLRIVTPSQNSQNRSIRKNNTSGFIGIHFKKIKNKYKVEIYFNNKAIHLGNFIDLKDAVIKRIEAEKQYFGEYRNLYNELKFKELYNE